MQKAIIFTWAALSCEAFSTPQVVSRIEHRFDVKRSGSSVDILGEEADLLRGKLEILQDVVKELNEKYRRQVENTETKRIASGQEISDLVQQVKLAEAFNTKQTRQIEDLHSQLSRARSQQETKIQRMDADLQLWRARSNELEKRLQREEDALETAREHIEESRRSMTEAIENASARIKLEVESKVSAIEEDQALKFEKQISKMRDEAKNSDDKVQSLSSQIQRLMDDQKQYKEQIEITTAAARASERRLHMAKEQNQHVQIKYKRSQVQLKLQHLAIQGLIHELEQCDESGRHKAYDERMCKELIKEKPASVSLWDQIRSRLSRMKRRFI